MDSGIETFVATGKAPPTAIQPKSEAPKGCFGERLRREREKRGITLDSVSEKTKIGAHILEAFEKDEFDKLPAGIFRKSFARSYARSLGLNEEQVLKEFIEVAGDPEQPLPDPPVPRHPQIPQPKEHRSSWAGISTLVVCAIAILLGGSKAVRMARRAAEATRSRVHSARSGPAMIPAGSPAPEEPENGATSSLQPISEATSTPAAELIQVAAPTPKFVVLVRARSPAWVSITADGKSVLEGVLKRKKKIHAHSEVVLTTNDAGALAISRNGKPLPPLGRKNQQTTVTFTPDGVSRQ